MAIDCESFDWKGRKVVPTNLPEYFSFAPPPAGFNPLQAPHELLLRHGFPLPPDPRVAPKGVPAWRRAMSRYRYFVVPRLRPLPKRKQAPGKRASTEIFDTDSFNWSGAVLSRPAGEPFQDVFAQWTLPALDLTVTSGGVPLDVPIVHFEVAAWVGLDGNSDAAPNLLQAGTAQNATVMALFGNTIVLDSSTFAWFEWRPGGPVGIDLPVAAGQSVAVMVQFHADVQMASASYMNLTTGAATAVMRTLPSGAVFHGATAEWIVERPTDFPIPSLPNFGVVDFTNLGAHTSGKGVLLDATGAQNTDIVSQDGRVLLAEGAVVAGGSEVQCTFVA